MGRVASGVRDAQLVADSFDGVIHFRAVKSRESSSPGRTLAVHCGQIE